MPSVALVITTYNRPAALDRVLDSVSRQTQPPEQVIIADDGSDERTTAVVESWRPVVGGEDQGYAGHRRARGVRNDGNRIGMGLALEAEAAQVTSSPPA